MRKQRDRKGFSKMALPTAAKFVHLKVLNIYVRLIAEFPLLNELIVAMPDGNERHWNYQDVD